MSTETLYDSIGQGYSSGRQSDPRIASQIHGFLAGAQSILNLGAGAGSYEPPQANLVAVEPSETMIRQRPRSAHRVVRAFAESLPFADSSFSHCMSVLSMHHWTNRQAAFREILRVTRDQLVVVTWDPNAEGFWLTRDYFPEIYQIDKDIFPPLAEFARAFGEIQVVTLPIPATCTDGFTGAYWRRPDAYLDRGILERMSTFAKISDTETGLAQLQRDLRTGEWLRRNVDLLDKEELDIGYRIVLARMSDKAVK